MITALLSINWLAVLAAAALNFVLGGAWFMVLFKRQYAEAMEIEAAPEEKPGFTIIVGPFICSLVVIATTAFLFRLISVTEMSTALTLGAVLGIGLLGAQTVTIAINPNFPKPFYYSAINVPYFLIGSLITSAVLVLMT
ncbi:DUF1761 domain-containing protein [uncultured Brevundimonas sp.]|uniref:DUF1761 domain-containing protein n=1 Tax=uncultured Brevundimonas sp. TaxID=213418 RepID=UPI0025EFE927|nr:DUF1761 domain-containing protein [uncultured Brevundimonas sp.]